jgi:hypothetical protein
VHEGVKVAREKLHEAPEGRPEQLKETGESNAFNGVIETVVVAVSPAVTVSDGDETATAMFCEGAADGRQACLRW